jgi:hypothetical protein
VEKKEVMSYIMVDVETDGEIPGDFSMISPIRQARESKRKDK